MIARQPLFLPGLLRVGLSYGRGPALRGPVLPQREPLASDVVYNIFFIPYHRRSPGLQR